jgi:hypothetical protein
MNFKLEGVRQIVAHHHVHGGPALSCSERSRFKENVRGFVWEYKKQRISSSPTKIERTPLPNRAALLTDSRNGQTVRTRTHYIYRQRRYPSFPGRVVESPVFWLCEQ